MAKSAWQHSCSGPRARSPLSRAGTLFLYLFSLLDGVVVEPCQTSQGSSGSNFVQKQHPVPWFCGWEIRKWVICSCWRTAYFLCLSLNTVCTGAWWGSSLMRLAWLWAHGPTDLHLPSAASHVQSHLSVWPDGGDAHRTRLVPFSRWNSWPPYWIRQESYG